MIRNDSTWNNKIKSLERSIRVKAESKLLNYTYQNEIHSAKLNEIGFSSDVIIFGEICSNKLSLSLMVSDDAKKPIVGDILTLYQEVDGTLTKKGKYRIEKVKDSDNSNLYELECYDALYCIKNSNLTFTTSTTIKGNEILTKLNNYLNNHYGVSFSSADISKASGFSLSVQKSTTFKYSDILPKMLQFIGYNARCGNDGTPVLYWITNYDYTISYSDQMLNGFVKNNDQPVVVDSLTAVVDENTSYTVNRSTPVTGDYYHINISFENEYFTQAQLNSLKSRMDNLIYFPCSVDFRGNIALEVGDRIKVETQKSGTVYAIVCSLDTTLTGMSASLECNGTEEELSDSGSTAEQKVEALSKELHQQYLNIQELNANYADIEFANINAENVNTSNIRQLLVKALVTESVTAENIRGANLTLLEGTVESEGQTYDKYRKVSVGSTDKYQVFNPSTQTWSTRIIIGAHSGDDYNITIYNADGDELFNATGVTYEGALNTDIATVLNSDSFESKIQAKKIDIQGIVTEINNGTKKLKSSSVYFEASEQTLDVVFQEMQEDIEDASESAENANTKIDNLEIGGRNLITNSNFKFGSRNWSVESGTVSIETDTTYGQYGKFTLTGSNQRFYSSTKNVWNNGETYTYSFMAKADSEQAIRPNRSLNDYGTIHTLSTSWKKYTGIIKSTATATTGTLSFSAGKLNVPVYITNVKLEKGNKATDWTPAPEDSITTLDVEYYLSTSATSLAGGSWSTTAPTWVNGKYMWSRTKVTDGSGNSTYRPSENGTCIAGAKGETGSTGGTGKGISSITEEYYLSTSKTTQTGGSWTTTPPTWESGKYVWTRSKIVYTNPASTEYTTPICDSSWEAVNEVEVGGRNLLRGSKTHGTITSYNVGDYHLTSNFSLGEEYTISANVTISGRKSLAFYLNGGSIPLSNWITLEDSSTKTYTAIFKATQTQINSITTTTLAKSFVRVYASNNSGAQGSTTVSGSATVNWIKLEKGNKATDWTPAPEDVDSSINSVATDLATETATRSKTYESLISSYKMSNGLLDFMISNVNTTALTTKPADWDYAYYKYFKYVGTSEEIPITYKTLTDTKNGVTITTNASLNYASMSGTSTNSGYFSVCTEPLNLEAGHTYRISTTCNKTFSAASKVEVDQNPFCFDMYTGSQTKTLTSDFNKGLRFYIYSSAGSNTDGLTVKIKVEEIFDTPYVRLTKAEDWVSGKYYEQSTGTSNIKMTDKLISLISKEINFYADDIKFEVGHELNVNNNFIVTKDGIITIKGGTINIGTGNFSVDSSGNLTAKNATLYGSLTGVYEDLYSYPINYTYGPNGMHVTTVDDSGVKQNIFYIYTTADSRYGYGSTIDISNSRNAYSGFRFNHNTNVTNTQRIFVEKNVNGTRKGSGYAYTGTLNGLSFVEGFCVGSA